MATPRRRSDRQRGDGRHDGRLHDPRHPAGPLLFTKQTAEVYAIIAGMIPANIVMIGLGFLAALSFAALMKVPAAGLNTFIVVFCFLGAYALRNDMADVWLTMLFGILGFFMRRWDLPVPPLVMGVILGPMAEQYFVTSMVSNANVVSIFVTRPVSAVILLLSAVMVLWPIWKARRRTS
jgi:putative tricarboxylic transport membrane protein